MCNPGGFSLKRALLLLIIIIAAVSLVISLTGSNDTVLLIPLDSRPVNTQYAQLLGEMVNVKVILPDATLLDSYRKPAQTAKLMDWLEQSAPEADRILIASNELFNGGLMASREARSYQDLAGQWEKLRSFLRKNKKKTSGCCIYCRGSCPASLRLYGSIRRNWSAGRVLLTGSTKAGNPAKRLHGRRKCCF